jgi:hypothetical protein
MRRGKGRRLMRGIVSSVRRGMSSRRRVVRRVMMMMMMRVIMMRMMMMTRMRMRRRISVRKGSVGIKWRKGLRRRTGKKLRGRYKRRRWSQGRNDDLLDLSTLSIQTY